MFPMKATQEAAVAMRESTITPEQTDRQVLGTPRREQQLPWFLPPAPHRSSLCSSLPHTPARALMSDMLALYEHNGKHTSLRSASTQHAVTL